MGGEVSGATSLQIGYERFQAAKTAGEIWIDDVAIGTSQIGVTNRNRDQPETNGRFRWVELGRARLARRRRGCGAAVTAVALRRRARYRPL